MTDIEFTAEEDEGEEYSPEQTEVCAGTFIIFDTDAFRAALNCLAVQMTDEGALYVVDAETHKLRALEMDDGKSKSKLTRVQ